MSTGLGSTSFKSTNFYNFKNFLSPAVLSVLITLSSVTEKAHSSFGVLVLPKFINPVFKIPSCVLKINPLFENLYT